MHMVGRKTPPVYQDSNTLIFLESAQADIYTDHIRWDCGKQPPATIVMGGGAAPHKVYRYLGNNHKSTVYEYVLVEYVSTHWRDSWVWRDQSKGAAVTYRGFACTCIGEYLDATLPMRARKLKLMPSDNDSCWYSLPEVVHLARNPGQYVGKIEDINKPTEVRWYCLWDGEYYPIKTDRLILGLAELAAKYPHFSHVQVVDVRGFVFLYEGKLLDGLAEQEKRND